MVFIERIYNKICSNGYNRDDSVRITKNIYFINISAGVMQIDLQNTEQLRYIVRTYN